MKKINLGFILLEAIIMVVPSILLGFLLSFLLIFIVKMAGNDLTHMQDTFFRVISMASYVMMIVTTFTSFNEKIANKTMSKNMKEHNFQNYSTFYATDSILRIDSAAGKVAYVSKLNPFKFQLVPAKEMTDIKSDYRKEVLGGTRYVYFEFKLNKQKMRFPTFTASGQTYSLSHSKVVDGIAKADLYAELLTAAKNVAMGVSDKENHTVNGDDRAKHVTDAILR